MNKIPFRMIPLVLIAILMLTACVAGAPAAAPGSGSADSAEGSEKRNNTLTAVKVDEVSLDAAASYWTDAPRLTVPTVGSTEDRPDGSEVTLQAVYDGTNIAVRAEWADATESVPKNAWTWDGNAFTKSGNEDRIMFTWPMVNIPEFATKGCAAACHNMAENEKEWWMGSDSEDVRYDVWHWKAARTNPVGQADDKWWSIQEDPSDPESSRHGDAKDGGGYKSNRNEDKSGPMFVNAVDPSSPFILSGQEAELDISTLEPGAVIPGYILSPFQGSRGDISAKGTWSDGKWVVVLMRALDTGHEDDLAFTPPKPYPFGMSIIDDGGGLDHTNAPEVLVLEWK